MARADLLVVARNLAGSRTVARHLIEQGRIRTELGVVDRASQLLPVDARLVLCDLPPTRDISQDLDQT